MHVIRHFHDCPEGYKGMVITVGNFDGIHLGHTALLNRTTDLAKKLGVKSAMLTFEPHTAAFFSGSKTLRLSTLRDKILKVKNNGIDLLIIKHFSQEFSTLTAKQFIEQILCHALSASHVVIGHDFVFGANKEGNAEFLAKEAQNCGFTLSQIDAQEQHNIIYSSSAIRAMLTQGDIKQASNLLGYQYAISGRVTHGYKRGATIGYPTINIELHDLHRPKFGVYSAVVIIDEQRHYGMANLGIRPTIGGIKELLEVHIFDFADHIYGKRVTVELIKFIRDEQKFDSLEELTIQLKKDEMTVRALKS